ncbi:MAG TPA: cyclic nucleotide-binding domain-containing protein [Thermoanaerobaculia bacterium]|nr:cyclic nucleotide-binding domain-containing protein [Thermoanaerobaculia bacterium]
MREIDFLGQLRSLLSVPVKGLDARQKVEIVQRLSAEIAAGRSGGGIPEAVWVPFVTGRRPIDEASYPRLGSSDHVGLILGDERENRMYLLFRIDHLEGVTDEEIAEYEVRVTLSFAGPWGSDTEGPLGPWNRRKLELRSFEADPAGGVRLVATSMAQAGTRSFVVAFDPNEEFLSGKGWSWSEAGAALRETATDAEDPFTFGHLFVQQVRAELVLLRGGVPLSASETMVDICDARRFGSLYRRVLERVVAPDAALQATREGIERLDPSRHPWFPVLLIGADKADLYTRALVEDIVHKKRHLTDPRWLLRVGLYLEFLTCIGIFEAVRGELGDLLTPAERRAWESSPHLAPIRAAVDVDAWRGVWSLRPVAFAQGTPGNVSVLNLLAKKKATLAFLEAHHEDLKRAIELAGANEHNAQETWHRVFRDAERAVLRKTPHAFPELEALGPNAQEFVLWHRKGKIRGLQLPQSISGWFGDQDGLYASACSQYRASMNHVSEWAKQRGLMDYTGAECIPRSVSLLEAFMEGRHVRLAQLQRRDGYAGALDMSATVPPALEVSRESVRALLRNAPVFRTLTDDELADLASSARPIELGPVERIIVQGRKGSSLFVVAEGSLEVLVRQKDGVDLPVATLEEGAVFGEMSLLTGATRSATVRSVDPAVVYEIGHHQLAPILRKRPSAIDELAAIMEPRLRATEVASQRHGARRKGASLASRIRAFVFPRNAGGASGESVVGEVEDR